MNDTTSERPADKLVSLIAIDLIQHHQGMKGVELAARVASEAQPYTPAVDYDYQAILEKLVKGGEIVEIEYVLPSMPERVKSFLLPAGAKIRSLRGGGTAFIFTPEGMPSHVESIPSE